MPNILKIVDILFNVIKITHISAFVLISLNYSRSSSYWVLDSHLLLAIVAELISFTLHQNPTFVGMKDGKSGIRTV